MSPSEQKTALMIYKAQLDRELSLLQTLLNEQDAPLPEAINDHIYRTAEAYKQAIETALKMNEAYRMMVIKKLKELQ